MRNRNHSCLPALGLGTALLLSACSSKTIVESDLDIRGAPDWVNEGTQILNDRSGRLFHGVGQASAMGDQSLQISTSDNRARAEVARVLSSYMDVVSNDYASAVHSGGERINAQSVTQQIQNFTRLNPSGAKIFRPGAYGHPGRQPLRHKQQPWSLCVTRVLALLLCASACDIPQAHTCADTKVPREWLKRKVRNSAPMR